VNRYHDDQSSELLVLVPKKTTSVRIDPGSGVVALRQHSHWRVYFEGNRYHAVNLRTIQERLCAAAGRLLCRYPTVAQTRSETLEEYVVVGAYALEGRTLYIEPEHRALWAAWTSGGPVDADKYLAAAR